MTTYTAVCRRSGRWWAISVPELKGVHTQARRLDQAEAMAGEAVALMLDADPAAIGVEGASGGSQHRLAGAGGGPRTPAGGRGCRTRHRRRRPEAPSGRIHSP